MADDTDTPEHVKVRMKAAFSMHNEHFRPGVDYWVSRAIYNDATKIEPYGKAFKDLCESANPEDLR